MFELSVQREFRAVHAITIAGRREKPHAHNWRVEVVVCGEKLDADGLLCDFHAIEDELDGVIADLEGRDLNVTAPFDEVNPTAEQVAKHLAERLGTRLNCGVRIARVSVGEAPGCTATYRMS